MIILMFLFLLLSEVALYPFVDQQIATSLCNAIRYKLGETRKMLNPQIRRIKWNALLDGLAPAMACRLSLKRAAITS
jgi:hypothetical protein